MERLDHEQRLAGDIGLSLCLTDSALFVLTNSAHCLSARVAVPKGCAQLSYTGGLLYIDVSKALLFFFGKAAILKMISVKGKEIADLW